MSSIASISHRDWIRANPHRWYRITRRGREKPIGWGLVDVEVMHVCEGRRIWGMQNIFMRPEIPNTDAGAKTALAEYEVIFAARMAQMRGDTSASVPDLLAYLRDEVVGVRQ